MCIRDSMYTHICSIAFCCSRKDSGTVVHGSQPRVPGLSSTVHNPDLLEPAYSRVPAMDSYAFRQTMFPDPDNWDQYKGAEIVGFTRGDPLQNTDTLVAHGCPLSIAYKILQEGHLVAGNGHHSAKKRTVHGIFVISHGTLSDRLGHARDRSTTNRDTEWSSDGLTGWFTPCVLVFPVSYNRLIELGKVARTNKSALEMPVGTKWKIPQKMMLSLHLPEYRRYNSLPPLMRLKTRTTQFDEIMMCGGKERKENGTVIDWDPLYWSRDCNNMHASCGRTCIRGELSRNPGWTKSGSHIWFCSVRCKQRYGLADAHGWDN